MDDSPVRVIARKLYYFAEYDVRAGDIGNWMFGMTPLPIEVDEECNVGLTKWAEKGDEIETILFSAVTVPLIIVKPQIGMKLIFHYIPQYGIYAAES